MSLRPKVSMKHHPADWQLISSQLETEDGGHQRKSATSGYLYFFQVQSQIQSDVSQEILMGMVRTHAGDQQLETAALLPKAIVGYLQIFAESTVHHWSTLPIS